LPARIKLKTHPTPTLAEVKAKRPRRTSNASTVSITYDAPRTGIRSRATTPSLSTRPGITLAPADEQAPRRGANEPEIKVYHLMSGNDKPLKLFIRRVGENGERVMVRVGGGWADLADYLKQYAEHHGHRTVSEGKVEVLGLGNDRIATPGSNGRNSSLGYRSESRFGDRSASSLGMRSESRQSVRQDSPALSSTPFGDDEITPNATPTAAIPPSNGSGSRRTSSFWDEGGLMGPAAVRKNSEISGVKKDWVDSVVEQAKTVGRKVEFGDLGKKGGTRRVFMKNGRVASGAGNAEGEKS
jgi:hypothetical protein